MEKNIKQLILKIKQKFGEQIVSISEYAHNETIFMVAKNNLPAVCSYLCKEKGGRLFTMVGNDERSLSGFFGLYYVFAFSSLQHFISVKIEIDENEPTFPSVAAELPAMNWYEREVKDLLGLRPQGHPDPRPLILHGDWPEEIYPLRKDFPLAQQVPRVESRESFTAYAGEDITVVPVGPIHAGIIEPGHFRFGAVGDTVLHLDARLFYTHKGIEKAAEGMPFKKALFMAERICGVCAFSHAVAFAQAVESIGQVVIPARANYLRTLFLELERLYNHIGDVGNVCAGFGFTIGISQGARLKEYVLELNERITGHRYLRGIVDLGGLRIDLTEKDCVDIRKTLDQVEKEFKELTEILFSHEIALNRMQKTGVLSLEQVNDLEVVGVAARASGRSIDIRRDFPFAAYDKVVFDVPCDMHGDVLARIQIRADEAIQSFSIIKQLLETLPKTEIRTEIPMLEPYRHAFGWVESPRGETVHWLMSGPDQTVYRYRIRSATYSNWPAVPLAVPGNIIPDFPLINKSFELCYACCDR